MPVGEDCVAWPYRADILAAVWVRQEDSAVVAISVDGVVVGGVVRIRNVDRGVYDWDEVLAVCVETFEKGLAFRVWIGVLVVGEVAVLEHVVDVYPYCLKRDVEVFVGVYYVLDCSIISIVIRL